MHCGRLGMSNTSGTWREKANGYNVGGSVRCSGDGGVVRKWIVGMPIRGHITIGNNYCGLLDRVRSVKDGICTSDDIWFNFNGCSLEGCRSIHGPSAVPIITCYSKDNDKSRKNSTSYSTCISAMFGWGGCADGDTGRRRTRRAAPRTSLAAFQKIVKTRHVLSNKRTCKSRSTGGVAILGSNGGADFAAGGKMHGYNE
jgi:hypothetical protein